MSVTQTRSESTRTDNLRCSRCNTILPPHATFCGSCGQRVDKSTRSHSPDTTDIAERYRIVSLVRRRAYVQLFLAIDNDYRRPVIIRDIDISSLDEEGRAQAIAVVQEEYDLLRSRRISDVMPVIDLRYVNAHLYVVAGWPFAINNKKDTGNLSFQYYTLHDLLQSGIGIPGQEVAITWAYRLCRALNRLHSNQIVIGDLDPRAIVVSDDHYEGLPALMVSWLPLAIRNLLPPLPSSDIADAAFSAPEVDSGAVDARSDLYSLGAILYLLLTGLPPDDPATRKRSPLPSPRELMPEISSSADEVVMQALALDSGERFQNAAEMAEALLALCSSTTPFRLTKAAPAKRNGRSTTKVLPVEDGNGEASDDLADATISIAPRKAQEARQRLDALSEGRTDDAEIQAREVGAPAQVQAAEASIEDTFEEAEETDAAPPPAEDLDGEVEQQSSEAKASAEDERERNLPVPRAPQALIAREQQEREEQSFSKRQLMERLSGILPILPRLIQPKMGRYRPSLQLPSHPLIQTGQTLLTRVRHFIVGEQQHETTAAALIEAPLRVQPERGYVLRIKLMGRDQPVLGEEGEPPAGLSGLVCGDLVHVEVRSALFQNYAYVVQRAQVQIPARGYVAEITIPMQALSKGSSGRRERFQIFFMDEEHNPLYEKPFVIEIFVSPLVSSGREGHSVLAIPL